jgi:hypothetical protein
MHYGTRSSYDADVWYEVGESNYYQ